VVGGKEVFCDPLKRGTSFRLSEEDKERETPCTLEYRRALAAIPLRGGGEPAGFCPCRQHAGVLNNASLFEGEKSTTSRPLREDILAAW